MDQGTNKKSPWAWIPSLYFVQGMPYVVVMTVSTIMFKDLGLENDVVALYTSLLYLPWVFKPIWSPLVEVSNTKRNWTIWMQWLLGAGFIALGFALTLPSFFMISIGVMWVLAFSSATHDIAADGFYMLGLEEGEQSFFVGFRSFFYRVAMMSGEGGLVLLAGFLSESQSKSSAWSLTMIGLGVMIFTFGLFHKISLPNPAEDRRSGKVDWKDVKTTIVTFFKKDKILIIIAFLLLFRFGEAQLVKLIGPFMLDPLEKGGLALSTITVGNINLYFGVPALIVGGILGGILASRDGMKKWFWPMVAAINLPNLAYVWLAWTQTQNFWEIGSMVALEKFGYGFGFTGFMLYLLYIARGQFKTAHYALGTGLMALGMMIPGMWSGALQLKMGYLNFFLYVMVATIPSFVISTLIPMDSEFGKKK